MGSPSNDIIPADWSQWSATKPTVIEPLTGGLTNQSFLISADNTLLVLRINSAISTELDLNRTAEAQALQLASAANIAAELVYCDPHYGYLVTRYLLGDSWLPTEQGLAQLAVLLQAIHQLPAIDTELNINAKVASYWRTVNPQLECISALKKLDKNIRQHIAKATSLSNGLCLCHNDLLIDNLMTIGKGNNKAQLLAIDWEYAAMADCFYELAVIVEGHSLNLSQQNNLLTNYLNRPVSDEDWQRLYHWRVIYNYFTLLWYVVQFSMRAMRGPSIKQQINQQIQYLSGLVEQGMRAR